MPDSPDSLPLVVLETRIGTTPGTYPAYATDADLKLWLELKGIPRFGHNSSERASIAVLRKAYANPGYLRGWLRNVKNDLGHKARLRTATDALNLPTDNPDFELVDDLVEKPPDSILNNLGIPNWAATQAAPNTTLTFTHIAAAIAPIITQALAAERAETLRYIETSRTDTLNEIKSSLTNVKDVVDIVKENYRYLWAELKATKDSTIAEFLRLLPAATELSPNSESEQPLPLSLPKFIPRADPNFYFEPRASSALLTAFKLSHNTLLTGPTGCGKTQLPLQLCAKLGIGATRVNCNGEVSYKDFIGSMAARSTESGAGETYFAEGIVPRAMKAGLKLILDEVDYMPPHICAIFNPILEHEGQLYIPETGETIIPAPGFCVVGTMNTGGKGDRTGQYTGTEVLNTAFLDRWSCILRMTYLPDEEECELIHTCYPDADRGEITQMVSFAAEIRGAFERGQLAITLSTRKLLDYFTWRKESNSSQLEILGQIILNLLDEDDEALVKTFLDRLGFDLTGV